MNEQPIRPSPFLSVAWQILLSASQAATGFLFRHAEFLETMILGGGCALLCLHLPFMGDSLARICLITAGGLGLLRELRSVFSPRQPYQGYQQY